MLKLLENFWLKVIAVVMGLFVWFHVATEKTYNYEISLPVMQLDLQDGLTLASNPPESLLVTVSADGKQLLRKDWRHNGLRINLVRYDAGRHQVTLDADNTFLRDAAGNVTLDDVVFPAELDFRIDHMGQTTVPVIADVNADADEGFAVTRPIVTMPAEVTLHGPRSLLSGFQSVSTEPRVLTGLRDNLTLVLPLIPPPSYGVRLEPDSVHVTLEVVPVKTRVFENLPIAVYNIPPRTSFSTEPDMVTVELTGSPAEIDQLDHSALTVSADYRQANEYGMTPLRIDCPPAFTVRRQSVRTVKITLESNVNPGN